ncbi:hypothetical protein Tco_0469636 [Tanacetum coccineum]
MVRMWSGYARARIKDNHLSSLDPHIFYFVFYHGALLCYRKLGFLKGLGSVLDELRCVLADSLTNLQSLSCSITQSEFLDFVEDYGIALCYDPVRPSEGQTIVDAWKRIFTKGRKTKPKTTKLSTEWKSVKRRSQIEAKKSIKSKSQQKSQTVKVKVNPDKVKIRRNIT